MAIQPIRTAMRQPKLSDVIEKELERLILEGIFAPGQKLPPERELAAQFNVSRPSIREAILRLEMKKLLTRRQGGGTFVTESLWKNFSDPLIELLSKQPESGFDLLEARHALEGISSYFAALRGTEQDLSRICICHDMILAAQREGALSKEMKAVMQYLIAVTEASHNLVLLHIVRSLTPLLEQNILQNFTQLNRRPEVVTKITKHRADIVQAIIAGEPEVARQASHAHLAFIEQTLLNLEREEVREARSLRRLRQRKATP